MREPKSLKLVSQAPNTEEDTETRSKVLARCLAREPALQRLLAAWPRLSEDMRRAILAIVDAACRAR
jgi:hypothetical protein